ncbi:MAG: SWF/SNF helicase family protein, partial [Chloroflexi bacterium]|nr:SWF/SNF helicase family protein [Chloroflexota bacterium]
SPRSLRAFEQSLFSDDWRDLMRLFLVRRTRRFIMANYAQYDTQKHRYYVLLNGQPFYFPLRQPRNLTFTLDDANPTDQYARLYRDSVVEVIQNLSLPRYGLANYLRPNARLMASAEERRILDNLNRAGKRLIGFSRTNLFKRLESSGHSFLLSLQRHVLRNLITLHALEDRLPIPIGTQDAATLDTAISDADAGWTDEDGLADSPTARDDALGVAGNGLDAYRARAAQAYAAYRTQYQTRFQWLSTRFFSDDLRKDLLADAEALLGLLGTAGQWDPHRDAKLDALYRLLTEMHQREKVLVFTQFADTATYLAEQLQLRSVADLEAVTAQSSDPTALARRFSPCSNRVGATGRAPLRPDETELRVLVTTDVLAEGQNLQDCAIVVNYDLPWAISRLIQRAGRVDRIGQQHDTLLVYSFLPVAGVGRVIPAACTPETPALPRRSDHHDLTAQAVKRAVAEVSSLGGQLGSLRSTRRKAYERLKTYREALRQISRDTTELDRAFDALFRFPLTERAREALSRQLRLGISDPDLAEMVVNLHADERLVKVTEEPPTPEPIIVCSMGLKADEPVSGGEANA